VADPTPDDVVSGTDELTEDLAEELAGDVVSDPSSSSSSGTSPSQGTASASVMRSSLVMSAGTVLSRFGGVLRGVALAAALGAGTVADMFTLGNTLPNVVYILVIGGALNAVFIPELVRHMKDDPDGGDGYAHRLITLVGTILLAVSILAVIFAPWIVRIYATPQYTQEQLDLATAFARFCLPQIFFYGVYTMLSQVLNARGRFGAPMFAPIANNVVAIATFVLFIVVAGPEAGADGVLEPWQVTLLGVGTTLGVAVQALVLVPVLRRARYVWRPHFSWRGAGLGTAGGLAFWTIGLVLVNQLAYAVIVRLATGVNAVSEQEGKTAAGLTAYTNAHLMFVLPHSVITVSIVAALLPRMSRAAHDRRLEDLAADVASGMRSASALIVPAAVALVVLGTQAGVLLFNYGQTSTESAQVTGALASVFAVGLLPFTLYYVILRGWYALELTRTAFWVTVVLNALNLAIAVPLYAAVAARQAGPAALAALAAGYVAAYWLTLLVAWRVLSRRLGGLETARTVRALVRMLTAGLGTLAVMGGAQHLLADHLTLGHKLAAVLDIAVVGSLGLVTYLLLARVMRVTEVTEVLSMLRRRVPLGR
jgi:putative peptidoglycan lipid II flippase